MMSSAFPQATAQQHAPVLLVSGNTASTLHYLAVCLYSLFDIAIRNNKRKQRAEKIRRHEFVCMIALHPRVWKAKY